jgi:hypothetical protein
LHKTNIMYKKQKKDNSEAYESSRGIISQKASGLKKGKGTSKFRLKLQKMFSKNILKR